MTTNDVKNPRHRLKVLERRINHWEIEINYIQDRIDIMKHEAEELKEVIKNEPVTGPSFVEAYMR